MKSARNLLIRTSLEYESDRVQGQKQNYKGED